MTESERLKELLSLCIAAPEKTCPYPTEKSCRDCKYDLGCRCDMMGRYADYLLENGVIVPPCKVGQTVYVPDKKSVQEYIVHAVERDEKHLTIKCHGWLAEREGLLHKHIAYFNLKDFGKTVFLTKEEAEKATKERI